MRLATIVLRDAEEAGLIVPAGVIPVASVNQKFGKNWPVDIFSIIQSGALDDMKTWFQAGGQAALTKMPAVPKHEAVFGPLYRHPSKIWGIGLNYVDHADDLAEKAPSLEPASFAKFDTTLIGPGDQICIPLQSNKTTAEAELGVIFGKKCKNVEEKDWLSVVAGFTTLIDMTAEDILRINPRYLTRAKNFDTFFSFGPELVTPDEIEDVLKLNVATIVNRQIYAQNMVSNMTFPPACLVSFHTKVATMLPGDILCTGTPRAVQIRHGDVAECWIDGFAPLANPVIDLKTTPSTS
ncbi:MAG: fumarylacetoacetate hydrolase family protein [Negativicutes bacterium]|nr:fumarylacetoacetate hydrolase family protein [Negativicutes bacterium]